MPKARQEPFAVDDNASDPAVRDGCTGGVLEHDVELQEPAVNGYQLRPRHNVGADGCGRAVLQCHPCAHARLSRLEDATHSCHRRRLGEREHSWRGKNGDIPGADSQGGVAFGHQVLDVG